MLRAKKRFDNALSLVVPSSPTFFRKILKRVKGTKSYERSKLRENTQSNVVMLKNEEIQNCEYTKPLRKLNAKLSHSLTEHSDESTSECAAVHFTESVEEICYLPYTPDAKSVEEVNESKLKLLSILGLDSVHQGDKGADPVVEAVSRARAVPVVYPLISIVPLNDEKKDMLSAVACKHDSAVCMRRIPKLGISGFGSPYPHPQPAESPPVLESGYVVSPVECNSSTTSSGTTSSELVSTFSEDAHIEEFEEDGEDAMSPPIIAIAICEEDDGSDDDMCPIRAS